MIKEAASSQTLQ